MGSLDRANISGFLCRLCSEMHRTVIHIYGDKGRKLSLVEKINGYLPISVSNQEWYIIFIHSVPIYLSISYLYFIFLLQISCTDPLPKTICFTCMRRVEQHYNLLMRLSKIRKERVKHIEKVVNLFVCNSTPLVE